MIISNTCAFGNFEIVVTACFLQVTLYNFCIPQLSGGGSVDGLSRAF